jgi:hypothetical protein
MDTEQHKDTFEDEFNALPEGLKEALASPETAQVIEGIGKKFLLHLDVVDTLFDEIGLVMLGITLPREFVGNLRKRLGVSESVVTAIALEVNEKIFQPIRDSLKELHGSEGELPTETVGKEVQSSITPTAPSVAPTLDQTRETFKSLGIEAINETAGSTDSDVPDNLPIDRESLLAEIEGIGSPTTSINVAVQQNKQSVDSVPIKATTTIESTPLSPMDILTSKLTSTVSLPDQKIDMSADKISKLQGTPYKIDPYREPII